MIEHAPRETYDAEIFGAGSGNYEAGAACQDRSVVVSINTGKLHKEIINFKKIEIAGHEVEITPKTVMKKVDIIMSTFMPELSGKRTFRVKTAICNN